MWLIPSFRALAIAAKHQMDKELKSIANQGNKVLSSRYRVLYRVCSANGGLGRHSVERAREAGSTLVPGWHAGAAGRNALGARHAQAARGATLPHVSLTPLAALRWRQQLEAAIALHPTIMTQPMCPAIRHCGAGAASFSPDSPRRGQSERCQHNRTCEYHTNAMPCHDSRACIYFRIRVALAGVQYCCTRAHSYALYLIGIYM